jgi:hypothetical protein
MEVGVLEIRFVFVRVFLTFLETTGQPIGSYDLDVVGSPQGISSIPRDRGRSGRFNSRSLSFEAIPPVESIHQPHCLGFATLVRRKTSRLLLFAFEFTQIAELSIPSRVSRTSWDSVSIRDR